MKMFPYGLQHVIARTIIGDQISCVNILFYVSHLWGFMHGISKTLAGSRSKMSCTRYYPMLQIVVGARWRTIRHAMYVWIKKNEMHHCHICGYVAKFPSYLARHMLCHSREKSITCNLCDSKFKDKCAYRLHMKENMDLATTFATSVE